MLILDTTRPFTRATALSGGLSDRQLAGPGYRRVYPGVYVASTIPDSLVVRARAALLAAPPGGTLSHHTAAQFWSGLALDSTRVHVAYSVTPGPAWTAIKIHRHRHPLDRARRHGIPVTSPQQTFVHLARHLDLVDLVAVGDAMVRRRVIVPEELAGYAALWDGQCRRAAAGAAYLVRRGVDSAPESKVRLLMVLAGLPEPVLDHRIFDDDGVLRYRIELAYPEVKLAIEYDGRWHEDPVQRLLDARRRSDLESDGWRFVVLVAEDLSVTPEQTLRRLAAALRECGIPVPRHLSDAWHRHFPGREASA